MSEPAPQARKLRLLALKGGGQKALAQIAVLEALEEITKKQTRELFDVIGGTSAGAINAAHLACGHSAQRIREGYFENRYFRRRARFWRSLFDPANFRRAIEEHMPPDQFKFGGLPCELVLVSKNLSDGINYVFTSKTSPELPVAEGVMRSASLPPFFEPIDKQWIDGAVAFNNPTEPMVRYLLSRGYTADQMQVIYLDTGNVPIARRKRGETSESIMLQTGWLFDAIMAELDHRSHASVRHAFPALEYHLMSFTYSKNFSMVDRRELPAIYEEACRLSTPMVYDIIERCFAEYAQVKSRGTAPRTLKSMINRF